MPPASGPAATAAALPRREHLTANTTIAVRPTTPAAMPPASRAIVYVLSPLLLPPTDGDGDADGPDWKTGCDAVMPDVMFAADWPDAAAAAVANAPDSAANSGLLPAVALPLLMAAVSDASVDSSAPAVCSSAPTMPPPPAVGVADGDAPPRSTGGGGGGGTKMLSHATEPAAAGASARTPPAVATPSSRRRRAGGAGDVDGHGGPTAVLTGSVVAYCVADCEKMSHV